MFNVVPTFLKIIQCGPNFFKNYSMWSPLLDCFNGAKWVMTWHTCTVSLGLQIENPLLYFPQPSSLYAPLPSQTTHYPLLSSKP